MPRNLVAVLLALAACQQRNEASEVALSKAVSPLLVGGAKVQASDTFQGNGFGWATAVSGDTLIVGAPGAFDPQRGRVGAAYVFVRTGGVWTQQAKLTVADTVSGWDFGWSVSISGDTAVIGAFEDDVLQNGPGSAYVFVRSGTTWTQQAKLVASDGFTGDWFGFKVGVSGDTAVVTAARAPNPVTGFRDGVAYVFERSGTTWTQQQKLWGTSSSFGWSAAISGDTIAIGANLDLGIIADGRTAAIGAVYVFVRSGGTWTEQAKLRGLEPTTPLGVATGVGVSVSLSGDTLITGGTRATDASGATRFSAGYVFERIAGTWTQQATLVAGAGGVLDVFAPSVAVSGDTAIVGVYLDDAAGADAGVAKMFVRNGGVWSELDTITAIGLAAGDWFGFSVALAADGKPVVGAPRDDNGAGSLFVDAVPVSLNGTACSANAECFSGRCVDGVCCNAACLGVCQACNVAGSVGTCGPEPAGSPCGDQGIACALDDTCDGAGVCRDNGFASSDTVCRPAAGACDSVERCSGLGPGCPADLLVSDGATGSPSCGAYMCSGGAPDCPSSCVDDLDCVTRHHCVAGVCTPFDAGGCGGGGSGAANGTACTAAGECTSGNCVDGVCCDSACDRGCEQCNASGSAGTCTPSPAGTQCRASANGCDKPESCDGASRDCPADTGGRRPPLHGKTMICHATGSTKHPFLLISVANRALPAHRHHGDIIPAPPGGCSGDTPPPPPPPPPPPSPACTNQPCYDGPAGTEGIGACRAGTMTCNEGGAGCSACQGAITPRPEICGDGVDNDCDGNIDNGCVGDRVWRDLNANGVQDTGEPGLANVSLRLMTSEGALVQSTTSDPNGAYHFAGVSPGAYFVEVDFVIADPTFFLVLTSPNIGGNDSTDSDPNTCPSATGCRTPDFTLDATLPIEHIDVGYTESIGD